MLFLINALAAEVTEIPELLDLHNVDAASAPFQGAAACQCCVTIVNGVKHFVDDDTMFPAALSAACQLIPVGWSTVCSVLVQMFGVQLGNLMASGMDGAAACSAVKLC